MGQVAVERQGTLGDLSDLPDIDFLTVPVDDYFGSYVAELGARGQQESLPLPMTTSGLEDLALPDGTPSAEGISYGSAVPDLPGFGDSTMTLDDINLDTLPPIGQPLGSVQVAGGWSGQDGGALPASDSGSQGLEEDEQQHHSPHSRKGANGVNKAPQKRSAKQQVQNKQAQQRYRERRKQRFAEMEHVINDLSDQLAALKGVQNQNEELKVRATMLERMVNDKQVETEQLQRKLQQMASVEDILRAREDTSPSSGLSQAEVTQYKNAYAHDVSRMKQFLEHHDLHQKDRLGRGVDPAIMTALGELVSTGFIRCMRSLRASGVQALDLMTRDLKQVSRCECPVRRSKWATILQELQLSDEQTAQLLRMRKNGLAQLRAVLVERQSLNMKAISEMLPRPGGHPADLDEPSAIDGKMACIERSNNYLLCARRSVQLNGVLDAVKSNLHQEQKRVMEMMYVTVHRVLSPIQAAICISMAHPAHVDILALVNLLASNLGQADSGSGSSGNDGSQTATSTNEGSTQSNGSSDKPCPLLES